MRTTEPHSLPRDQPEHRRVADLPGGVGSVPKTGHQKDTKWVVAASSVLAAAVFLRFYQLALRPLHHDEGVNGFFLLGLFREGIYRYNAANYHGPTLYYFALITSSINNLLFGGEGPSTVAIRLVPAILGVGLIALVLSLRNYLGSVGALTAAALVSFSPGMVYLSRDFIHEMLLGFFTLWLVVSVMRFLETQEPKQLMLGSIAAAMMFATKETWVLSLLAIAAGAGLAWLLIRRPAILMVSEIGGWRRVVLLLLGSVALFLACSFLFFSSFMGNSSQGIREAVATYSYWVRTGVTQQKAPWYTYLTWLLREEPVILVAAAIGSGVALYQRRDRFAIFAGIWGLALLFIYSAIPYKTPWILLNIIVPAALVAGYTAQQLWNFSSKAAKQTFPRLASLALIGAGLAFSLYQSVQLNFYHYDDGRYVYPYVQTRREFLGLVEQVYRLADSHGSGKQTSMAVLTPEYWPLPWYLRDYKNAGYLGKVEPTTAVIVIASVQQYAEVVHVLAGRYRLVGAYPLRPGVELLLYVVNGQAQ